MTPLADVEKKANSRMPQTYRHTQTAPLYLLLVACSAAVLILAAVNTQDRTATIACLLVASIIALAAGSMRSLTISDAGDALKVRFGPVPLFGTSLPYAEMTSVQIGRSSFMDGWGIHFIPWRGWTYNLWGFDCVVVRMGKRTVRLGTDDREALCGFLQDRLAKEDACDTPPTSLLR